MASNELANNCLLNLDPALDRALWQPHPGLLVAVTAAACRRLDKDDLELAPVEVVTDDELVAVLVERTPGLGQQQLWVGLELRCKRTARGQRSVAERELAGVAP